MNKGIGPNFQFHLKLKDVNFAKVHMVSLLQQVLHQKFPSFFSYRVIIGSNAEYLEMANKIGWLKEWNLSFNFIWSRWMSISQQYTWLARCNKSCIKNYHRSIVIELLVARMQNIRKWLTKTVDWRYVTLVSISFEVHGCQFLNNTHC